MKGKNASALAQDYTWTKCNVSIPEALGCGHHIQAKSIIKGYCEEQLLGLHFFKGLVFKSFMRQVAIIEDHDVPRSFGFYKMRLKSRYLQLETKKSYVLFFFFKCSVILCFFLKYLPHF